MISDESVNPEALAELATGDDSYAKYVANGFRSKAIDVRNGPVTVRRISDETETDSTPSVAKDTPPPAESSTDDTVSKLLGVIDTLERELERSDLQNAELRQQISRFEEEKCQKADLDQRAREVIARHTSKG